MNIACGTSDDARYRKFFGSMTCLSGVRALEEGSDVLRSIYISASLHKLFSAAGVKGATGKIFELSHAIYEELWGVPIWPDHNPVQSEIELLQGGLSNATERKLIESFVQRHFRRSAVEYKGVQLLIKFYSNVSSFTWERIFRPRIAIHEIQRLSERYAARLHVLLGRCGIDPTDPAYEGHIENAIAIRFYPELAIMHVLAMRELNRR